MSSIQHIYNELFSGKTLVIVCETFTDFESLRTALCKKNSICVALDMTTESIVARYDQEKKLGTYQLTMSRRQAASSKWQIVSVFGGDDSDDPSAEAP